MKPPIPAPAYAALYPSLCNVARSKGYALAIHGTLARDMDLIAVPWTPEAVPAEELVIALWDGLKWLHDVEFGAEANYGPERKPHGRVAWTIPMMCGASIDLSVMPLMMQLNGLENAIY